jgi:hypothetical protein
VTRNIADSNGHWRLFILSDLRFKLCDVLNAVNIVAYCRCSTYHSSHPTYFVASVIVIQNPIRHGQCSSAVPIQMMRANLSFTWLLLRVMVYFKQSPVPIGPSGQFSMTGLSIPCSYHRPIFAIHDSMYTNITAAS